MFKYLIPSLISIFLLVSVCKSEEHWAVGGWDCRHWGSLKISEDHYAFDLDPEGIVQDFGVWQDYDQYSVVIVWQDSYRIEIINKHYDKFYRQVMIEGFGAISEVEQTRKINTKKMEK